MTTYYCQCGCGGVLPVRTRSWGPYRKGEPIKGMRFIHGHNSRTTSGVALTTPLQRFWAKVDKTSSCWLWTASTNLKGYGHLWVDGRYEQAHRFAYEHLIGPIPDGLHIDHLCNVPQCVNPRHLEPVELEENSRRRREREASATHFTSSGDSA